MRKFLAIVTSLTLCLTAPAASRRPTVHTIRNDDGGILLQYVAKFVGWENNGDKVRLEGDCLSACTILLGIVDTRRVCAISTARFGFHSASNRGRYTSDGTEFMWFFYGGRVREVLALHDWASPSFHPTMLMIDAREIVRACE